MKNKWKIVLLIASMAVFTVACGKQEEKVEEPTEVVDEVKEDVDEIEEQEKEQEVDISAESGKEVAGGTEGIDNSDMLKSRVESSAYIAVVKYENDEFEITEQLKGEITPDAIMKVEGIEDGSELLIFVMDLDGMTMYTDEDSIVLLDDAGQKYLEDTRELLK